MGRWHKRGWNDLSPVQWVLVAILALAVVALVLGLNAYIILFCWNWLVTRLGLGLPTIGFWDAVMIYLLLFVLASVFRFSISVKRE